MTWVVAALVGVGALVACGTETVPSTPPSTAHGPSATHPESSEQAPPDVDLRVLQTAEVPENCQIPRQRLVDGRSSDPTGENPHAGGRFAIDMNGSESGDGPILVAFGDFAGLGYKQALVSYQCTAGGVSWPETLVLVGAAGRMLASYDLGQVRGTNRASVESMVSDEDAVTVKWASYDGGVARNRAQHTSTVTYRGNALVLDDTIDPGFILGSGRFGPVKLPASPAAARRGATQQLGQPTVDEGGSGGCTLFGADRQFHRFAWGELELYGEWNGADDSQAIASWKLTGPEAIAGTYLELPYGVTIGMSADEARSRIPGFTERDGVPISNGHILVKDSLWWILDDSNSHVVQIHENYFFCP